MLSAISDSKFNLQWLKPHGYLLLITRRIDVGSLRIGFITQGGQQGPWFLPSFSFAFLSMLVLNVHTCCLIATKWLPQLQSSKAGNSKQSKRCSSYEALSFYPGRKILSRNFPTNVPDCPIGQNLVTWPPLSVRSVGKQASDFPESIGGGDKRKESWE